MNDYKQLAIQYLKMNRRRSIITVLGVTVAVALLYLILNMGWSGLLNYREVQREKQNYEIVLMTETSEQIEKIMKDEYVKSALAGEYYYFDYVNPKTYNNALYINTTNPYRMNFILDHLEDTYDVKGDIHEELAWTYLQGNDGNVGTVIILGVIFLTFIFTIFGVGIVRNSIQLSTLEQIKDYGNLRCIGASKGQLKKIIYMEGAVLELSGLVLGIFCSTILCMGIGHYLQWKAGFHFVPVVPLLIAFLGDLYFVMEENCKVITNMTPVSAIRGEYRIKKEKIKVRKKSIYGRLFGVEGDYAYKNIMRNPGRFHKTVWTLGIGIALFMMVMGCFGSVLTIEKDVEESYKYYQIFYEQPLTAYEKFEILQSKLPPSEILGNISQLEEVTEAKRIYSSMVYLPNGEEIYKKHTDEFLKETGSGKALTYWYDEAKKNEAEDKNYCYYESVTCYGYDKTDYERYQSVLTDGTLDVSENGIVLINGGEDIRIDSESLIGGEPIEVTYTGYKVGDTIEMIDMHKLRSMMNQELERLTEEYEKEKEKLEASIKEGKVENPDLELTDLKNRYFFRMAREKQAEYIKKLKEEKAYKMYTIEGIVSEDINRGEGYDIAFILPIDRYFDVTATDETMVTGMQYHVDKFPVKKFVRAVGEEWIDPSGYCKVSLYPMIMWLFDMVKGVNYAFILFVVFIMLMTAFNVINTTASNLHLRRKEFAQLRVIGVSQKGIMKMVMLEGVIETFVACLIGIILGTLLSWLTFHLLITMIFGLPFKFPLLAAILAFFASTLILCGSAYMSLRNAKQSMVNDLATGGD